MNAVIETNHQAEDTVKKRIQISNVEKNYRVNYGSSELNFYPIKKED